MNKNKIIYLTLGLFLVIGFYFLMFFGIGNISKSNVEITSFVFVILNFILIYGVSLLLTSKKLNTYAIAGLISTTFIYTAISLIFNVILKNVFTSLKNILVFNFGLLLMYLLLCTIIMLFKKEAK